MIPSSVPEGMDGIPEDLPSIFRPHYIDFPVLSDLSYASFTDIQDLCCLRYGVILLPVGSAVVSGRYAGRCTAYCRSVYHGAYLSLVTRSTRRYPTCWVTFLLHTNGSYMLQGQNGRSCLGGH